MLKLRRKDNSNQLAKTGQVRDYTGFGAWGLCDTPATGCITRGDYNRAQLLLSYGNKLTCI